MTPTTFLKYEENSYVLLNSPTTSQKHTEILEIFSSNGVMIVLEENCTPTVLVEIGSNLLRQKRSLMLVFPTPDYPSRITLILY